MTDRCGGIGILGVVVGAVLVIAVGFLFIGNPLSSSKTAKIEVELLEVSADKT